MVMKKRERRGKEEDMVIEKKRKRRARVSEGRIGEGREDWKRGKGGKTKSAVHERKKLCDSNNEIIWNINYLCRQGRN